MAMGGWHDAQVSAQATVKNEKYKTKIIKL